MFQFAIKTEYYISEAPFANIWEGAFVVFFIDYYWT